MIVAKFSGSYGATVYGLTQWDYGQELAVECSSLDIPDGSEVQFYQMDLSSTRYIKNRHVLIPDLMLQNPEDITAYVYVRSSGSGQTVLTMRIPIQSRLRPENYILPEYEDYKRLIPEGGQTGQSLIKKSETDYDTEWAQVGGSDIMEPMTDDEIDRMFLDD